MPLVVDDRSPLPSGPQSVPGAAGPKQRRTKQGEDAMSEHIQPCIDRPVPEAARLRAIERAMASRADDPGLATAGPRASRRGRYRMAVLTAKAWKPGRELTVGFMNGDAS